MDRMEPVPLGEGINRDFYDTIFQTISLSYIAGYFAVLQESSLWSFIFLFQDCFSQSLKILTGFKSSTFTAIFVVNRIPNLYYAYSDTFRFFVLSFPGLCREIF